MPELPEVETTRMGIRAHVINKKIKQIIIRQPKLRWPVPAKLPRYVRGRKILSVERRGKYLLLTTANGCMILHLGMSGSLRITQHTDPADKHDHVDIVFANGTCLRFRDPRRFGCLLWTDGDALQHELLVKLGPEPLSDAFTADYLFDQSRKRKINIKSFIMNSHVVVGVGNIYASEALFMSGIRPTIAARRITRARYLALCESIKQVLQHAITQGGTTLRDFTNSDGQPGYFQQQLNVYGRGGEACPKCASPIISITQAQRSSFYCKTCQT